MNIGLYGYFCVILQASMLYLCYIAGIYANGFVLEPGL